MDAHEHLSGSDDEVQSRHSLNRPVAVPDPAPDGGADAWFTVVLRGYDRAQVDARLAELERRVGDEARRADAAESALGAARSHVRRLQDAATASAATDERSFGVHVERVLQAAEREASELRERAAAEATTTLDAARAEAEQRRRQTEQALLGRAATLDQEFTDRAAALDARERKVDDRIATAEREAERIREDAERAVEDERAGAERRAADLMRHAEETAREQRTDLSRDVDRLAGLRDEVREELSRIRSALGVELDRDPVVTTAPGDDPLTGRLRIAPARDIPGDEDDPNVRTTIGTIPPFTVSSIGVLPFRDRSANDTGNVRPFTSSGDTDAQGPSGDESDTRSGGIPRTGPKARTSDDGGPSAGNETRSTSSSWGPR